MMCEEKPLPCPFCGSENVKELWSSRYWFVTCLDCAAQGPRNGEIEFAKRLWNKVAKEAE